MTIDIAAIISAIPVAINVYTSLKDLINSAKDDLEKPDSDWCTLINSFHGFKISWASQRWMASEQGNVAPNMYNPVLLRSIMAYPEILPNPYQVGQFWSVVPTITVYVDPQGSIPMERYVEGSLENKRRFYQPSNGHFTEERAARKLENDSAIFGGRIFYPPIQGSVTKSILDTTRVRRSGNKMISVIGSMVEDSHNFDILFEDMVRVIKTVAILRK